MITIARVAAKAALSMFCAVALVSSAAALSGCAPSGDEAPKETGARGARPIDDAAKPNTQYPEAIIAFFDCGQASPCACAATLVAPTVALTSAQCLVESRSGFVVAAPLSGQSATASSNARIGGVDDASYGTPDAIDLGLLFLDTPITLPSYPTIATAPSPDGTRAVSVELTYGAERALLLSPEIALHDGSVVDFPYDYVANLDMTASETGGGVFRSGTHELVAVTSLIFGGQGAIDMFARPDLASDWILSTLPPAGTAPIWGSSACHHDVCSAEASFPLSADCNPCAAAVCASDAYCCEHEWDVLCVSEVPAACGATCAEKGAGACADVPDQGLCIGETSVSCTGGAPSSHDCALDGGVCGWSDASGWGCVD